MLRVCADPNNLPFSNNREEGFENKIARLLADEMHAELKYTWWAQRRGFVRNTLRDNKCDVIMGVPTSFELAATTSPYYRSSYVFVARQDRHLRVRSFDDPLLKSLRVGVQMIGDDYANSPPAHALATRGIVRNVRGYLVYGDYRQPNPPAQIINAVSSGEVDVAVVWGPLAAYFAHRSGVPLTLAPVTPQIDVPSMPFVFDIGVGVRRGDTQLKERIEQALSRRRHEIDGILAEYHVPRLDGPLANGSGGH
ncbi:MAG TPA: substrate-binding domain-containing protein [Terriglobales bacterium]|nr:substrate-binding domain-containing protein [Terriglobales bacterium]